MPANFRQSDLDRAIRAVKKAGDKHYRIMFDDAGKPIIIVEPPANAGPEETPENLKDLL
jgi:hypothetical protein